MIPLPHNFVHGNLYESAPFRRFAKLHLLWWCAFLSILGLSALPAQAQTQTPLTLTATAGTEQVSLSWNAASVATSYEVQQSASGAANTWSQIATPASSVTSYTRTGLTAGTLYYFRVRYFYLVRTVSTPGNWSNVVSATPIPLSTVAPANFTAVAGNAQVSLSWNAVSGATYYNLWRRVGGANYAVIKVLSTTSWVDSGLTNGTTYDYSINAGNTSGATNTFSYASAIPFSPTPPSLPAGLVASSPRSSVVNLSWSAAAGATSYDVLRSTTNGGSYGFQANVSTNSWSESTVTNGTTYYYVVVAKNSFGSSASSNQDSVMPLAAPTGLSAIPGTSTCYLSWNPVVGATSYNVRRQYQPSTGGSPRINQFSTTATNYRDSFPSQGFISYNYAVQAVNSKATGDFSSIGVYPASVDSDLNTLSLSPATVQGGTSVTGTVTLTNPPQSGNAVISLSSNNAAAIVPASVTIAGGTTSTTFTVSTTSVTTQQTATITASYAGIAKTATLTITVPPAGNHAPVANAQNTSTTKNVVLNGTLTATDADSNTLTFSKVSDPTHGTVTVASSGAFTYTPATDYTGGDSFTFKANDGSLDSNSAIVSITVNASTPPAGTLSSFTLAPTSVVGGAISTATVALSGAAPANIVVNLSSDNTAAQVPASVTIAAGTSSTQFNVVTSAVTTTTTANISATYGGVTQTKPLTITAPDSNTPNGLEAVSTGSGKMTMYWDQVAGATGYNVYRGTSAGMENYSAPVNGATLINSPSYVGSSVQMFTNTGLTNGTEYFYTVKAVVNGVESAASNEDSDIVDPNAIPWDTRDPQQILGVAMSLANSSIEDGEDLISTDDDFSMAGPDGAVYNNQIGTQQPPSGTVSADGSSCILQDGTIISLPYVDWDSLAANGSLGSSSSTSLGNYHTLGNIPGPITYPYRGIRTDPGYQSAAFDVTLGPVNITAAGAAGKDKPTDSAFVCLGSLSRLPSGAFTDSCDAGLISTGGHWRLYMQKGNGRTLYDGTSKNARGRNNFLTTGSRNNMTFVTSDVAHLHLWVGTNAMFTGRKKAATFIRITNGLTPGGGGPGTAFGLPGFALRMDGSNACMYRLQQLAQHTAYTRTGSVMSGFNWTQGLVNHVGQASFHRWGAVMPGDICKGYTAAVSIPKNCVSVAPGEVPVSEDKGVTIVMQ